MQAGRMEETIVFGAEDNAELTNTLRHSAEIVEMPVHHRPQETTIILTNQKPSDGLKAICWVPS
jgi:hypothetical protein